MRQIDDAQAVAMHRDQKLSVRKIAARLQVQPPAIYKAFRRAGYAPHGLYVLKSASIHRVVNKPRSFPPTWPRQHQGEQQPSDGLTIVEREELAIAALRQPNREPCARCGVRADVGCRHSNAPTLGWHVG